jgi:hypothetical protein
MKDLMTGLALVDTGMGLRRIEALIAEMSPRMSSASERDSVICTALLDGIASEVQFLLDEIETRVKVPALVCRGTR